MTHGRRDGVDMRAMIQQHRCNLDASPLTGLVQGGRAGKTVRGKHVGSSIEQQPHHGRIGLTGGHHEYGQTGRAVARIGVGAVREQPLGQSNVARFHGGNHPLGEIPPECCDDRRGVAIRFPLLDLAVGDLHPRREADLEIQTRRENGGNIVHRPDRNVALDDQVERLEALHLDHAVPRRELLQDLGNAVRRSDPRNDIADAGYLRQILPFDVVGHASDRGIHVAAVERAEPVLGYLLGLRCGHGHFSLVLHV